MDYCDSVGLDWDFMGVVSDRLEVVVENLRSSWIKKKFLIFLTEIIAFVL